MSADAMGRRLLAEVQEEGLDQLLAEFRHLANPQPEGVLHLPQLDRLLEVFRAPPPRQTAPESQWTSPGLSEGVRSSSNGATTPARPHSASAPKAKPAVIQLSSDHSASGKTSLLFLLTALAVLPNTHHGKEETVVWLDPDGRFSATHLQTVLIGLLSTKSLSLTSSEKDAISNSALHHVHVFRPQSSSQLHSTLSHLPTFLLDPKCNGSTHRSLGLIILDSVSAFYWQDRFALDMARLENPGATSSSTVTTSATEIITALKALQSVFDCTVIFTHQQQRQTRSRSNTTSNSSAAAPHTTSDGRQLPQEPARTGPWTTFATLSISLACIRVPQFAPQMSLAECTRDQTKRLAAVRKGLVVVSVDCDMGSGGGGGGETMRSKLSGKGSFVMRITQAGVGVEE